MNIKGEYSMLITRYVWLPIPACGQLNRENRITNNKLHYNSVFERTRIPSEEFDFLKKRKNVHTTSKIYTLIKSGYTIPV